MLVTSNKNLKLNLPTVKFLGTPLNQYSPWGCTVFQGISRNVLSSAEDMLNSHSPLVK